MLSISTNISALMASAEISSINIAMEDSMERMSTGKRINGARDDSAGLAISSRLNSSLIGLRQGIKNAMDASALLNTAEGALNEVENIVQSIREIWVQAANDTNSAADRTNLNTQAQQLLVEVDHIARSTAWAGQNLLDGTFTNKTFLIGSEATDADKITISINIPSFVELGVDYSVEVTSATARTHISVLDEAMQVLNSLRGELGASINQISHVIESNTNAASNLAQSISRIDDADYAVEATSLARFQILQQAATTILAQANASKQNVVTLIQG
ncbi:flagellin [Octadecabacter arcticus 238]|uniref:Flagellin n=1 Tax=Octadecabacter arcticus 238 TaxID=391616 RepID=M9RG21_9RHOB|nr:flagellin [Octadecabacter arcticus]AGI71132.1 flagellin [Octadecabacter arcticus 238]